MRLHANIIFGFLVDSCPVIFEEKGYIYIYLQEDLSSSRNQAQRQVAQATRLA